MTAKQTIITQQTLTDLAIAQGAYLEIKNKIDDRVQEIIHLIHKIFEQDTDNLSWWYYGAAEGEVGEPNLNCEYISMEMQGYGNICTDNYSFSSEIPKSFLLMSDDEIISFVNNEIAKDDAKRLKTEEAKTKAKISKAKAEALSKLTKEEKKVLGLK